MSMLRTLAVSALIWLLAGCSPEPEKPAPPAAPQAGSSTGAAPVGQAGGQPSAAAPASDAVPVDVAAAPLQVFKSPTCGCCAYWVDHMRESDFKLEVTDMEALTELKQRLGIARELQSCHTTQTADGRYFFEGHVPAPVVAKFLASPPANAVGLAVPAMPIGSPGMEMDDRFQPYDVLVVYENGTTGVFARMETQSQQYN